MKRILIVALCLIPFGALAQKKADNGAITSKELMSIKESMNKDDATTALGNVISNNNNLKSLSLNRDMQGDLDHFFKYSVDVKGITNQHSSGRCWMFASMNAMRPAVMQRYNLEGFDFSHNYNYFWDMFEKSNSFLESIIATASLPMDNREVTQYFVNVVDDGGVWNNFYNVAQKYGVVPQSVMPETAHSDNTSQLDARLDERLRKGGYDLRQLYASGVKIEDLRKAKLTIMNDIYRILALSLGNPPTTFSWRYKTKDGEVKELVEYTPLKFYNEIKPTNYNPENYIMIMNDPTRDYYKLYDIKGYRNMVEGHDWLYLNLPNDVIKAAALASIKDGEAMYSSCDVGKQANYNSGINAIEMYDFNKLFGVDFNMDKKARILTRQSGSAHAMLLMACDTDDNDKPIKWEFENSWGADSGNNGYLTFTDRW
ncbi:MAG: C1 family peptidase, partial [Rikenellaceae bacterium]